MLELETFSVKGFAASPTADGMIVTQVFPGNLSQSW